MCSVTVGNVNDAEVSRASRSSSIYVYGVQDWGHVPELKPEGEDGDEKLGYT